MSQPLPPGIPHQTEPVSMPSPFPAKPKAKAWKWGALGGAVLTLGAEVARIWYPALVSPITLLGNVLDLLQ
jgi:hypothetical protein